MKLIHIPRIGDYPPRIAVVEAGIILKQWFDLESEQALEKARQFLDQASKTDREAGN